MMRIGIVAGPPGEVERWNLHDFSRFFEAGFSREGKWLRRLE
jgi:hypothetical protein